MPSVEKHSKRLKKLKIFLPEVWLPGDRSRPNCSAEMRTLACFLDAVQYPSRMSIARVSWNHEPPTNRPTNRPLTSSDRSSTLNERLKFAVSERRGEGETKISSSCDGNLNPKRCRCLHRCFHEQRSVNRR